MGFILLDFTMRYVKADLHNHLGTESAILEKGFDAGVDIAFERLGTGGIVGLINFEDAYSTADNRTFDVFYNQDGKYERENLGNAIYVPEKDLLFVRGEEIALTERNKETHLLVLGTHIGSRIKYGEDLETTIEMAQQKKGVVVLDHPFFKYGLFYNFGDCDEDSLQSLQGVDALETHNGLACLPVFNPFYLNPNGVAQEFYKSLRSKFPGVGAIFSSDGKSFDEIGSSYSILEMPASYKDLGSSELNESLRKAIRKSKGISGRKINSYLPALKHVFGVSFKTVGGMRKRK